ncbi:MAG: hypothetical protein WCP36_07245 [Methanomicrobiales archaeon]
MEFREILEHRPLRTLVNPFDFFSELLRADSDQVIHMVLYFDGTIDAGKMQNAVTNAILAEPVCHSRLVEADDTLWWVLLATVNPKDCFSVLEKTSPSSALSWALSETIDPCKGPQVRVFLIQPEGGTGDILVINACHVAMDGRGLKDMAGLILELYHLIPEDPSLVIGKNPGVSQDLPLISKLIPFEGASVPSGNLLPGAGRWIFPGGSCGGHYPAHAVMTIPMSRVASIHSIRKELGVTLNDLLLAIVALARANLEGQTPSPQCSLLNTIDLRRYCPVTGRSVTNYSTAFEVKVPVSPVDTLSSLSMVVHEIMENKKSAFPGMNDALDAELLWKSGISAARETVRNRKTDPDNHETKIPIFTNTGIIDLERTNHCYPRVRNAWLLPCLAPPPAFFIAISTFNDTLTISATYHSPAFADEQVRKFFELINRFLPGYTNPGDECVYQLIPLIKPAQ